jgi:hypothetical protein
MLSRTAYNAQDHITAVLYRSCCLSVYVKVINILSTHWNCLLKTYLYCIWRDVCDSRSLIEAKYLVFKTFSLSRRETFEGNVSWFTQHFVPYYRHNTKRLWSKCRVDCAENFSLLILPTLTRYFYKRNSVPTNTVHTNFWQWKLKCRSNREYTLIDESTVTK